MPAMPISKCWPASCETAAGEGQRGHDRQGRVVRLTAGRGARLGLPGRDRRFREPHGQTSPLTKGGVILRPVRNLVPLPREVVTAVLVDLERHERFRGQERRQSPTRPSSRQPTNRVGGPCNKPDRILSAGCNFACIHRRCRDYLMQSRSNCSETWGCLRCRHHRFATSRSAAAFGSGSRLDGGCFS